ncbi:MAG: UDP-N-acetylmuramate dehydrogenase [Treponema sp.]|nr:UDP-N-acetylmuramate dehydrogenase [Treponema sp.]
MNKETILEIIDKSFNKNFCKVDVRFCESMKEHTTFKVGGTADCWVCPKPQVGESASEELFVSFLVDFFNCCKDAGIPIFILGGGANVVASDKGIRGIVFDMTEWKGKSIRSFDAKNELVFRSGTTMDEAALIAADFNLSGLEFFSGMPGTIGGALWMNARCYGSEISDVLSGAEIISREQGVAGIKKFKIEDLTGFGYKKSPFQNMDCLILNAAFKLNNGNKGQILAQMEKNKKDRMDKGHYLFPSAGSAFKNNIEFGKPTGQIIDELGLKGLSIGGAQVAPFHGNFIVNTGNASAADIRTLVQEISEKVKKASGFTLEPEILFVGDW